MLLGSLTLLWAALLGALIHTMSHYNLLTVDAEL